MEHLIHRRAKVVGGEKKAKKKTNEKINNDQTQNQTR